MPQVDIKLRSTADLSGFQRLQAEIDRTGEVLKRKLELPDIARSVLGGLGFGSGFAVIQSTIGEFFRGIEEKAEQAKAEMDAFAAAVDRVGNAFDALAKKRVSSFISALPPEQRIEEQRRELARINSAIQQYRRERDEAARKVTEAGTTTGKLMTLWRGSPESGDYSNFIKQFANQAEVDAAIEAWSKKQAEIQKTANEALVALEAQADAANEAIAKAQEEIAAESAKLDESLQQSAIAEQQAIDEARRRSEESGREVLEQMRKEGDELDTLLNKREIAAAQEREQEQQRAAERAREDIAAQRKAQQDAETTAAIRAAQDAVESYDTALAKLDANPYLTENEKQAERLRLLGEQTQAIRDQKKALDDYAAAHPGVDVGGLTSARDQIGSKETGASVDTYRTQNRQTGILGGIVDQLDAIGTWADQLQRAFVQVGDTIRTSLGSALADAVLTAGSTKDRIVNFANAIGTSFVQTAAQMVADWLWAHTALDAIRSAFKAKEIGETAATEGAKTGLVVAGEVARTGAVSAAAATNTAVVTSAAAAQAGPTGVAAVFRSIMELGPIAGPLVFAASAAAMIALVSQLVQGFEAGGVIPGGEQLIRVNERGRESVLNADATATLGSGLIDALNAGLDPADLFTPDTVLTRPAFAPNVSQAGRAVPGGDQRPVQVVFADSRNHNAIEQLQRDPRFRTEIIKVVDQHLRRFSI